jgi:hypothetical protein
MGIMLLKTNAENKKIKKKNTVIKTMVKENNNASNIA